MLSSASQAGLWDRALLFGQANKPGKLGFNSHRLTDSPRVRFATESPTGGPALAPHEAFIAWADSIGAVRHPAPEPARACPAASSRVAAPVDPAAAAALASIFTRFGAAPAFRGAFTKSGALRKGWAVVAGAPCWVGA